MKNYLATYRDGSNWCYSWFESESEAQEWLDNKSENYEDVDVIELVVVRTLNKSS